MMNKDIPLISQLLRAVIVEDYASAIEVITSEKFNPNETNSSWKAPVLSAIISVISAKENFNDKTNLKEILKEIVKHKDFDPNVIDAEGETPLMHIARHPNFNWLVPFIMNTGKVDVTIKNFMHRDALEIAEKSGNAVMADILLTLKIKDHKGQPKKRAGIKKITKAVSVSISPTNNSNILDRIEKAFGPDAKKNPVSLYNLLTSFFKGDYTTCIQIVRDVNFNPNECDRWEEPVLSSLMYYSQDCKVTYNEEMYKKIAEAIISNHRFNVNALDADCNTVLMVAMGLFEKDLSNLQKDEEFINNNKDYYSSRMFKGGDNNSTHEEYVDNTLNKFSRIENVKPLIDEYNKAYIRLDRCYNTNRKQYGDRFGAALARFYLDLYNKFMAIENAVGGLHRKGVYDALKGTKSQVEARKTEDIWKIVKPYLRGTGAKQLEMHRLQPEDLQIKKLSNDTRMGMKNYFSKNQEIVEREMEKIKGTIFVIFDDNISGGATLSDICMQAKQLGIEYIIPITFGEMNKKYNLGRGNIVNRPIGDFNYN